VHHGVTRAASRGDTQSRLGDFGSETLRQLKLCLRTQPYHGVLELAGFGAVQRKTQKHHMKIFSLP
jgi:hypothetical protein